MRLTRSSRSSIPARTRWLPQSGHPRSLMRSTTGLLPITTTVLALRAQRPGPTENSAKGVEDSRLGTVDNRHAPGDQGQVQLWVWGAGPKK
jgi:hypothetical protein